MLTSTVFKRGFSSRKRLLYLLKKKMMIVRFIDLVGTSVVFIFEIFFLVLILKKNFSGPRHESEYWI